MRNQWAKLGGGLGIVYCIVGFVLIFLGWNGAASSNRMEEQLPYVVSGGFAGLAFVVIGAALIVAYSLRTDRVQLKGAIDELRRSASATGAGRTAGRARSEGGEVLAGGRSYHVPTCTVVAGQAAATPMGAVDAVALGLEPCRVCHPDLTLP
jgi:hypothetical protein